VPSLPDRSLDGLDRRLAAPLVVLTCPPMFLAYREMTACGTPAGCSTVAFVGYALAALAGVPVALAAVRAAETGRLPAWVAPRPDDATLVGLAGVVGAVDAYLLLSLVGAVPPAAEVLTAPAGVLLGLPLVVVQAVVVAAGNTLGEPPMALQLLAVAAGVALSAAWWYVLAAGVGRLVDAAGVGPATDPRD
jgi:hypothetical protein